MSEPPPAQRRSHLHLVRLLPNLVTIAAICAGLTAIRFAFHGDFERAVVLVLAACVLDALDGRVARLLNAQSPLGAELDSLADFLNFGVAPGLLIYVWTLHDIPNEGWIAIVVYAICCVLRLARFNVGNKAGEGAGDGSGDGVSGGDARYFVGVPAPAGALLALLPVFVSFLFGSEPVFAPEIVAIYLVAVGLLMISRVPTWSMKVVAIPRERAVLVYLGFVILGATILTYPWQTLVAFDVVYLVAVLTQMGLHMRNRNR